MSRFQEKTLTELRDIKAGLQEIDQETTTPESDDAIVQCVEEIDAEIEEKSAVAVHNLRFYIFQALHRAAAETAVQVPGTDGEEFAETAHEVVSGLSEADVAAACAGTLTE